MLRCVDESRPQKLESQRRKSSLIPLLPRRILRTSENCSSRKVRIYKTADLRPAVEKIIAKTVEVVLLTLKQQRVLGNVVQGSR